MTETTKSLSAPELAVLYAFRSMDSALVPLANVAAALAVFPSNFCEDGAKELQANGLLEVSLFRGCRVTPAGRERISELAAEFKVIEAFVDLHADHEWVTLEQLRDRVGFREGPEEVGDVARRLVAMGLVVTSSKDSNFLQLHGDAASD